MVATIIFILSRYRPQQEGAVFLLIIPDVTRL